jgi:phosphopantetheinyl transferase (holo-ACP synthase)
MTTATMAQCCISDLAATRQATAEACLCAAEQTRLATAPVRRLAGVIAAKRAVLQAAGETAAGYTERDVQIGHDADGAPRLHDVPAPLRLALSQQRLHISISHTGDHAYGLAVLEAES